MMLSFDIAEFDCGGGGSIGLFQDYINKYVNHAAAAKVNGKSAVTTFMGQDCTFGQGNNNNGWNTIFGGNAGNIYWMPAYTGDPAGLGQYNIQAEVNWGAAWPEGGDDINLNRDNYFMGLLNGWGKKYVGTISPAFFAHMSYKVSPLLAIHYTANIRTGFGEVTIGSWLNDGNSSCRLGVPLIKLKLSYVSSTTSEFHLQSELE
jgi:hypothetical protein